MADVGVGFVDIIPRTDQFVSTLSRNVTSAITKVQATAQGQMSALTKGVQAGFVGLGVVAVAAISKGIKATVEWAAQVRSLQRVTGQSAESASSFAAAANILGIGVDRLTVGFGILARNIATNNKALTDYGIATHDAQGNTLPFDDVLGHIVDRFQTFPKGLEQAAFAVRVFGRSGRNLIPILARGRDGLAELRAEAEKTGLVLSQKDLDATKELGIAQRELGDSIHGAAVTLGKEFIPIATEVVKVVTAIVQAVQLVPAPVLAAVAAVTALTGAIAAGQLIVGFFTGTWSKLLTSIGLTVPVTTEATAGFTQLTLAATEAEVATGGAGLAGGLGAIASIAAPVAVGLGLIGAAVIALKGDVQKAHEAFQAGLTRDIEDLRRGGQAAAGIRRLARQPLITQNLTIGAGRGLSIDREAQNQADAIKQAQAALAEYQQQQVLAQSSTEKLAKSVRGLLKPITDLQTPISQIAGLTDSLGAAVDDAAPAFDKLARVSGQDFQSIGADLQKALADPKTTVEQLPGIFDAALGQVRSSMHAWRQDVFNTFGGAAASIQDFLGQAAGKGPNRVSFENLTDSLDTTERQLTRFKTEFDKLKGDKAATAFLQQAQQSGLDFLGTLDAVSKQPKKTRDEFFRQWNDVNGKTRSLASDITDAFGKAADRIVEALRNVRRAILGLPPIKPKVDTSEVDALNRKLAQSVRAFQIINAGGKAPKGVVPINPKKTGLAAGGILAGAEGFIATRPTVLVGEGRSNEAVIPLNERGANFARKSFGGASDDMVVRELRALRAVLEKGHGHELAMDGYRVGRALGVRQDRRARA